MSPVEALPPQLVLDSINQGVYVTDTARRIIYWGQAAEQITGWSSADIVGKHCFDRTLCHVDKDGRSLCGADLCPLHRCIATGQSSNVPIIMFARKKDGKRVPLQVFVAPLRDQSGQIIGGVETFRDLSHELADIERARRIQSLALQQDLPHDPRLSFHLRYLPQDIVGGDYYALARLGADRFGFLLADVAGHGVPAALYTMFLSSLWVGCRHLLSTPAEFARTLNDRLHQLIQEDEPFAAALCGLFDLQRGELRLVGAGNPAPLLFRADGRCEQPEVSGLPLGLIEDASYDEVVLPLHPGDRVLFFTDGAVEIADSAGRQMGPAGLIKVLQAVDYPAAAPTLEAIETRLLTTSNHIRFDDDVTFLEARLAPDEAGTADLLGRKP